MMPRAAHQVASRAKMAPEFPIGERLGSVMVTEKLRGALPLGQWRGLDDGRRFLITVTLPQRVPTEELLSRLAFPVEGVVPLSGITSLKSPWKTEYAALLEEEPEGHPSDRFVWQPATRLGDAAQVGAELGQVVARLHASLRAPIGPLIPGAVYVRSTDSGARLSGFAPRAVRFSATAEPIREGFVSLVDHAFLSPEGARAETRSAASDVFELALLVHFWAYQEFAFEGENHFQQLTSIVTGRRRPPPTDPLGSLLTRALSQDPAERPSLDELTQALSAFAAK
jgi:hypothetical protein